MEVKLVFLYPDIMDRYDLELSDVVAINKDIDKTKITDKYGGSIEFKTKTIESLIVS